MEKNMITLKDELKYLEDIKLDASYDEIICKKLKEYAYKIIECKNTKELYELYLQVSDLTKVSFPRIEFNIENKIEEDLEELKMKFLICAIDKTLNTKQNIF